MTDYSKMSDTDIMAALGGSQSSQNTDYSKMSDSDIMQALGNNSPQLATKPGMIDIRQRTTNPNAPYANVLDAAQQGILKLATGQGIQDRMNNIPQAQSRPFDANIPSGNVQFVKNIVGGLGDMATSPASLLGYGISGAGMVRGAMQANLANNIDNHIISTYAQAINPSIGKITNAAKLNEFQSKTVDAMKSIANNPELKLENPNTGILENRLPTSRSETFDALNQTKQSIFDKYNQMQKDATDKGVTIDVPSIAQKALNSIKDSRQYKLYAPELVQDANSVMGRLAKSGKATPADVQDDIAFLNQKMKGFYQKGEYNQANVYANYAANLRSELDDAIEKGLGQSGYQDLKNQYASLKYVEKDLAKASANQLKNAHKGIGESFSNPIALAEMARGVFTHNPAEFATGTIIKGVSTAQKMLNNPDWRIANMFKNIKKIKSNQ